jgi:hypothetical protein
LFFNIFFFLFD